MYMFVSKNEPKDRSEPRQRSSSFVRRCQCGATRRLMVHLYIPISVICVEIERSLLEGTRVSLVVFGRLDTVAKYARVKQYNIG